jgi:spore germination protein KA
LVEYRHAFQPKLKLSASLEDNMASLRELFASCDDLVIYPVHTASAEGSLVYLTEMVEFGLLDSVMQRLNSGSTGEWPYKRRVAVSGDRAYSDLLQAVLSGDSILLLDKSDSAYIFATAHEPARQVTAPNTERTVKGAQDSFIEDMPTNLRMIRRKLATPALKVEVMSIGTRTSTQVGIVYVKGKADGKIVEEVVRRLSRIDGETAVNARYVQSLIEDAPRSPFPTVYSTDRPDRVCGGLLEGKVAILVDGAPCAMTVPTLFVEFFHSAEDYNEGSLTATLIRWVRFLGMFVALILPAFYVALVTFHQDLLQTPLLLRIAANRQALPYPVVVEGLFMLLTFELLREAGARMPRLFGGGAVTLIALVVISLIAVQAGLIGAAMTVVVSVATLTSFILPNYAFHQLIRLLGFVMLILAGTLGFMGIIVGLLAGLVHLVSLRSFGVPYFTPVSPARKQSWKDVFIRAPWWAMEPSAAANTFAEPAGRPDDDRDGSNPLRKQGGGR